METNTAVALRGVSKSYFEHNNEIKVLDDVDFDFVQGQITVIVGKSGSGKSTLLNLISGVDTPTIGEILVKGFNLTAMSDRGRTLFRRDNIGVVYQFFNLIPTLTVSENVLLPLELAGAPKDQREQMARDMLERVGIRSSADRFPETLSGGEQQRVAIARAIVHDPAVILADEPTGNLDAETAETVMDLFLEICRQQNRTVLIATHSNEILSLVNRVATIKDSKLLYLTESPSTPVSKLG